MHSNGRPPTDEDVPTSTEQPHSGTGQRETPAVQSIGRRRLLANAGAAVGVAGAFAGCLGRNTEKAAETTGDTGGTADTLTVTDTYGREVTVPSPVGSFATLNPHVYWAIEVLGVEDTLVAATGGEMEAYPALADAPDVGWYREPNVEKIAELQPEVLLTHYRGPDPVGELDSPAEELSPFGVSVVGIEVAGLELENMKLVAEMVGKPEGLDDFLAWRRKHLSTVKEGVADIPEDERTTVFFEAQSELWGAKHDMPITVAGGYNVMRDLASEEAVRKRREVTVDQETVMAIDPDVILLEDTPGPPRVTGYGATDDGPVAKWREEFLNRPGVDSMTAVQNDDVYVVDYKLMSAEKSWLGALYLAKLFYPNRFSDLDPGAVHAKYHTEWLDVDHQGIALYPDPW